MAGRAARRPGLGKVRSASPARAGGTFALQTEPPRCGGGCSQQEKQATRFPVRAAPASGAVTPLAVAFPGSLSKAGAGHEQDRQENRRAPLGDDGRGMLRGTVDSGKGPEERRQRGRILLLADEGREGGGRADNDIADILEVGTAPGGRVRRKRVEDGLEAVLDRKVQANRGKPLLDGEGEAKLTMLACSGSPEGHARWTLRMLGHRLVQLEAVDGISRETVRRA